jgi:hypothetical protein
MRVNISRQIARLPDFSRQQLLDLWLKLYRRAAPTGIRRELLVPFLAYRIQEQAYGGLEPATRSKLLRIARALENNQSTAELLTKPKVRPGTRIVRQWRGKTYEIFATEAGFEYKGTTFKSLSKIAQQITGTNWSGPAFFGMKKRGSVKDESDD